MALEKKYAALKKITEERKNILDEAAKFYNSKLFQWNEYPQKSVSDTISEITSAVYIFVVKNPSAYVEKVLTAVDFAKKMNKKNKLPKLNKGHKKWFKENGCLYIGSVSSETLGNRLKEHWRVNSTDVGNSTYALKICDWISDAKINKKDIIVYYCDMTGQKGDIIRIIEDCLATMYCPLLGKRGDSPKG